MWNLHPPGYFDEGRYLTIRPPTIPLPYPPARLEPQVQCLKRLAAGGKPDPAFHGWWSPEGAASQCPKETPQYDDKNKNRGVTIDEAIAMAPRLQGHLKMAARYLVALRDGMSAAWLLNRTFVFPRFGCLCDRSEWPDIMPTCRLENSGTCVRVWQIREADPGWPRRYACVRVTGHFDLPTLLLISLTRFLLSCAPPLLAASSSSRRLLLSSPSPPLLAFSSSSRLLADLEFPFSCPLNFLLNVHFMQVRGRGPPLMTKGLASAGSVLQVGSSVVSLLTPSP